MPQIATNERRRHDSAEFRSLMTIDGILIGERQSGARCSLDRHARRFRHAVDTHDWLRASEQMGAPPASNKQTTAAPTNALFEPIYCCHADLIISRH